MSDSKIERALDMRFEYNDGGRAKAGYKGKTGDCGVRAVAVITGLPYREVYNALARLNKARTGKRTARNGLYRETLHEYLATLGFLI